MASNLGTSQPSEQDRLEFDTISGVLEEQRVTICPRGGLGDLCRLWVSLLRSLPGGEVEEGHSR